jgi:predicted phage-related endonuclease
MPDNRGDFLGGSDAPAVLGLSPWDTPVSLWQKKLDARDGLPEEPNDAAKEQVFGRGHELEPYIVNMVIRKARRLGLRVELVQRNHRHRDPVHDFLRAEIDFELQVWGSIEINGTPVEFHGETINADAKSVQYKREEWGEEFTEDVPIHYAAQFMHGLDVTGRKYCLVGALMSFDDVRLFWLVRDEETIAAMRAKLLQFWTDRPTP